MSFLEMSKLYSKIVNVGLLRTRLYGYESINCRFRCFSSSFPKHNVINMPSLSPTMTQGNIGSWKKGEGDQVAEGDVIVEIETDKATMEFESPKSGYIAKIFASEGTKDVQINTPLFILVKSSEDIPKFAKYEIKSKIDQSEVVDNEPINQINGEPPLEKVQQRKEDGNDEERILATPFAKLKAITNNIDISKVKKKFGEVIYSKDLNDLQTVLSKSNQSNEKWVDREVSATRKVIAERLLLSTQSIPQFSVSADVFVDKVMEWRKEFNAVRVEDVTISFLNIITKAAAFALKDVPIVNSEWMGDCIRTYDNVDISIAVSTSKGLITPIIHNADKLGLLGIAKKTQELIEKARDDKLQLREFVGGTFSISNLGMYNVSNFVALINPPQAAILSIGRVLPKLALSSDEKIQTKNVLKVTLSCDHRVIDGADAAKWLDKFKNLLENPSHMIL